MPITGVRPSRFPHEQLETSFDRLIADVKACQKCPRMCASARVLDRAAGPLSAPIMFIGEAPGRLGADASGIPFHGDKAGDNFERLISTAELDRYSAFVTNAVLCNPKDDEGNNAPPTSTELANCAGFLRRQIDLINPRLVVTLGAKALESLKFICTHELTLAASVRTHVSWYGRDLVPLYHPGQRAMVHRSYTNQLADYYFVAELMKRREIRKREGSTSFKIEVMEILRQIFQIKHQLSYFSLHKLFFLLEHQHVKATGQRLSNAYIIRQKDGPYCTDLHISKILRAFPRVRTRKARGLLMLDATDVFRRDLLNPEPRDQSTDPKLIQLVGQVMDRYAHMSEAHLKSAVYLSAPMRKIITQESRNGRNMLNAPIVF